MNEIVTVKISGVDYVKDKTCHNCGQGWIVSHGDCMECEDCGAEIDAKCDSCKTPLETDGYDTICCKSCGGYEGWSKRQTARYEVDQAKKEFETAKINLEKAERNLDQVIQSTRGY